MSANAGDDGVPNNNPGGIRRQARIPFPDALDASSIVVMYNTDVCALTSPVASAAAGAYRTPADPQGERLIAIQIFGGVWSSFTATY